jgi:hypothetical protein
MGLPGFLVAVGAWRVNDIDLALADMRFAQTLFDLFEKGKGSRYFVAMQLNR